MRYLLSILLLMVAWTVDSQPPDKAIIIPPQPSLLLTWDWVPDENNAESDVVFIVRMSNSLIDCVEDWPIVAVVQSHSYRVLTDPTDSLVLFSVSASNSITNLDSNHRPKIE